jgi:tetratricopeptide (TPR) repeat protein
MDPAERARRFAGREIEVEDLVDVVRANRDRQSNQHVLLIGPRGIGKTALLLRVVDRVREDPDLSSRWTPIVSSEEIYRVSSIGEFWLEALFHLWREVGEPRLKESYERLKGEPDDSRLRVAALGALFDFADARRRRLLLVIENLQMVLEEQLADRDAWALRETLVGESRIMLLGSAVYNFAQLANPQAALYQQFLVHRVEPLDVTGCQSLWLAYTGRMMPKRRMRAILILTGGNPRLLVILSEFAARTTFRELMEDLVGLVDDHTDYLKASTEALPPIERKVFVALAELWKDSTAAEVAAEARLTVNVTSAHLGRLEQRGAVVARKHGRGKRYRLAERLYNIYHLMRRTGSREARVRAAVEFMTAHYDPPRLRQRISSIADEALSLTSTARQDHFLAMEMILSDRRFSTLRSDTLSSASTSLLACEDIPAGLRHLISAPPHPSEGTAVPQAPSDDELSAMALSDISDSGLLVRRGWLDLDKSGEEALAAGERALGLDSSSPFAHLLVSRACAELGRWKQACDAAERAVDLARPLAAANPAFVPELARSYRALASVLTAQDRHVDAAQAFRQGIAVLAPVVVTEPEAVAPLMAALCRDYVATCQRGDGQLDTLLLFPVLDLLAKQHDGIGLIAGVADALASQRRFDDALRFFTTALGAAAPDALRAALSSLTSLAVTLAASGLAREVLRAIEDTTAAQRLEPLVVALKKHLGEPTHAPLEIDEVASDIVREIEAARNGLPSPLHDEEAGQ